MSGVGSYTTAQAVRSAAAAHGYSEADVKVSSAFDRLLFNIASGTIDAALLVAHGRKTIQPEDFAALAKLHSMFSAPLAPKSRSSRSLPRARSRSVMTGGNVNTMSYYTPSDATDRMAYDAGTGGHGGSTTDLSAGLARDDLLTSAISPLQMGGAKTGKGTSRASKNGKVAARWSLPSESITRVLREYRLRFHTDVRMTGPAKQYLNAAIKSNIDAVLEATRTASKSVRLTSSAFRRASAGHVLVLT